MAIKIQEGTIQGCGLSNNFYDVGIKPLTEMMRDDEAAQIWICDDLSASGSPEKLKEWFQKLKDRTREQGYIPKPGKFHIVGNDSNVPLKIKEKIQRGELRISEGTRYLGAQIGTDAFKSRFLKEKVREHIKNIKKQSQLTKTSPLSA